MGENKKQAVKKSGKHMMTNEENDLMMNRLMLVFVIAVAMVTLVINLKNANGILRMYQVVAPVMSVSCIALFLLSLVVFAIRVHKKTDDSRKVLTRYNVLGTGCVALMCAAAYLVNASVATGYVVAIVMGACVLYFIQYIYPRDFFALSCFCLCEGFFIYIAFGYPVGSVFGRFMRLMFRIGSIAIPLLFVAALLLVIKKGVRGFEKTKPIFYVLCALIGFAGAVILMFPGVVYVPYMYVLYLLAAAYLAIGIAQTIKSI